MKIWGYTVTNSDEADVLPNCLSSYTRIPVDKIILVDSGTDKALIHHQRIFTPIEQWLGTRQEYTLNSAGDAFWNGVPLVIRAVPWTDPAHARNECLAWIEQQPDKPDWICATDSDEVQSYESEREMRTFLANLPEDVTNIVQPLANLVQDENHMAAGHHSDWLSHSRLHRVGMDKVHYTGSWHEHQVYTGTRMQWFPRIVHLRMLFRRRLFLQRGHPFLRDAWSDLQMRDLPSDITFAPIEWPDSECPIPFDEDIRTYDNGRWAK